MTELDSSANLRRQAKSNSRERRRGNRKKRETISLRAKEKRMKLRMEEYQAKQPHPRDGVQEGKEKGGSSSNGNGKPRWNDSGLQQSVSFLKTLLNHMTILYYKCIFRR